MDGEYLASRNLSLLLLMIRGSYSSIAFIQLISNTMDFTAFCQRFIFFLLHRHPRRLKKVKKSHKFHMQSEKVKYIQVQIPKICSIS